MISRLVCPNVEANSSSVIAEPVLATHEEPAPHVRVVGIDQHAVDVEDHGRPVPEHRASSCPTRRPHATRRAAAHNSLGDGRWQSSFPADATKRSARTLKARN